MMLGRSGNPLPAPVPIVSLATVRVIRQRHRGLGSTLTVFEALVWDPTAVRAVLDETKRQPVVMILAKREKA
jgi:hypothetical protein